MTTISNTHLFDLSQKVALVTGAASGIGKTLALGLADFGSDVVIADIDQGGLAIMQAEIERRQRRTMAVRCDVGRPEDIRMMFQAIDNNFGSIDILINNVGVIARHRPEEMTLEDWNRVLQINLTGTFLCAQEAARRMIRQGNGGSIINIGSTSGCSALGRGNVVYSTTKGAINQLTRELAIEWAPHKIRVNAILPAQTRTTYLQHLIDDPNFDSDILVAQLLAGIPLNRLGEPEDLVGPVVFLASQAGAFVTGALLPVDGGNLALNAAGSKTW